jgi:hypothetical protein
MLHQLKSQMGHSNAKTRLFFFLLSVIFTITGCNKDDSGSANKPPVADAGDDASIEFPKELLLVGNASFDPDGKIVEWLWSQIGGPWEATIDSSSSSNTMVNNLMDGNYKFELKVTDDRGSVSKDTIEVAVDVSNSTFTFDIEYDLSRAGCILFHENVDSMIPAGRNFDVFYQSGLDGYVSNWILVPETPSNTLSYGIVNGNLEIYPSPSPTYDCNFDDATYKARIVVY